MLAPVQRLILTVHQQGCGRFMRNKTAGLAIASQLPAQLSPTIDWISLSLLQVLCFI